jgi:3-methyladenine DNA glycosylase AlkD
MSLLSIQKELRAHQNPEKMAIFQRFFKTGPGEYAEGDQFLGLTVPETRKIAHQHTTLPLEGLGGLLRSPFHEERLAALFILRKKHAKGSLQEKKTYTNFYLAHTAHINNWDLVDTSAEYLVGPTLQKPLMNRLLASKNLWERRIAIIATFHWIKQNEFEWTLLAAKKLLTDPHDLLHKAVGWMLREVGKRDRAVERAFLEKNAHEMPRTMLRYALEHFPENERKYYMALKALRA